MGLAAAALAVAPPSLPAIAATAETAAESRQAARPDWFAPHSGQAAEALIELLATSRADGLKPGRYRVGSLERLVRAARSGDLGAAAAAGAALDHALTAYVRDLQRTRDLGTIYVDPELKPQPLSERAILAQAAAAAPSLEAYVAGMGWMTPFYAQLRSALINRAYADGTQRRLVEINMERLRVLPGTARRYVLVNAAAQRLFMIEDGQVVDSMRVVVGKPVHPTPVMSAYIRFAALNPYWNVPPDLAAERIAPNVLKLGFGYLKEKGYQVLTDWSDKAKIVPPSTVNWQAVAAGTAEVRLRQLPGPANSMGRMKFMFPNAQGIYLHDTPDREKLNEAARFFSGGCVRLEDAPRLGRWLFGRPLNPKGARPEQRVMLDKPVPVYLTYLTVLPSGSQLAFYDDIYGRDAAALRQGGKRRLLAGV